MFLKPLMALGLVLPLLVWTGCKGDPTAEDIEGWIRAGSFTKVRELTSNVDRPMELRVEAVQKLVEYGQTTELQAVLQNVPDREEFIQAAMDKIVANLGKGELEAQVESKNALFVFLPYLKPDQVDTVLKVIADWAFEGLGPDSSKAELVSRIEEYQMIGQLNRMKEYGVPVASALVSHGVETQTLLHYLIEAADTPELQRTALEGVRKLFAIENLVVPYAAIELVRKMSIPEAVDFLIGVYLNDAFSADPRSSALAFAQDLIYQRGLDDEKLPSVHDTPEKQAIVLGALKKLLGSDIATDRWDAAVMMLHVGGPGQIDAILEGLKADLSSYVRFTPLDEMELPDYVIIEMCRERLKPEAEITRPILEKWAREGDRVQKAVSTLCLKVIGDPRSVEVLKELGEDESSLETFFFQRDELKKRRALIAEGKLPELTVGRLAQNAIDGIALVKELEKARGEGSISEEDAKLKTVSALSVIGFTGDAYRAAVDKSFEKKKARGQGDESDGEGDSDGAGAEDESDGGETGE